MRVAIAWHWLAGRVGWWIVCVYMLMNAWVGVMVCVYVTRTRARAHTRRHQEWPAWTPQVCVCVICVRARAYARGGEGSSGASLNSNQIRFKKKWFVDNFKTVPFNYSIPTIFIIKDQLLTQFSSVHDFPC